MIRHYRTEKEKKEEDEWELVSSDSDSKAREDEISRPMEKKIIDDDFPLLIHKSVSTPNFTDEESYILDYESSIDFIDTSFCSQTSTPLTAPTLRKVPSFKDMILTNLPQLENEEVERQKKIKLDEEKVRMEALLRQKVKPRLIVNKIKRCTKSTGDLRTLVCIQEDEDIEVGGVDVIHEEDISGETDAMDYYHRKDRGCLNHKNSLKLRPDEAKRKQRIVTKKNAQRQMQRESAKRNGMQEKV